MIQDCVFDPMTDVEEVVPELAVDIAEVMRTGVVVSTSVLAPYTKEDDVHAVGHYLKDKIETMMAVRAVNASLSRQAAKAAAPAAPAAPAASAASTSQPASGE